MLGTRWVVCASHHGIHRVDDRTCPTSAGETFPLSTHGSFDDALAEARADRFWVYGDSTMCMECGVRIHQQRWTQVWIADADGSPRCPNAKPVRVRGTRIKPHEPFPGGVPGNRVADL